MKTWLSFSILLSILRPRYVIRKDETTVPGGSGPRLSHASAPAATTGMGREDCLAVICIGLTTSFKLLGVTLLVQRLSSNLQQTNGIIREGKGRAKPCSFSSATARFLCRRRPSF